MLEKWCFDPACMHVLKSHRLPHFENKIFTNQQNRQKIIEQKQAEDKHLPAYDVEEDKIVSWIHSTSRYIEF